MNIPFVLPIKTSLGCYIYEINRNEILCVNEDLFQYVSKIVSGADLNSIAVSDSIKKQFCDLQECGYLAPNRIEVIQHPLTKHLPYLLDRAVSKLALQVTQNCNLRCKYCVYSENSNLNQRSHTPFSMSLETAIRAVDFYRNHIADTDNALIGFYGGEPLLEFGLIKDIVEYSERVFYGREITFFITTNATLLTDEIARFLLDHNFHIAFSLDGPQKAQDRNRVFPNGKGTYDIVMKNIRKFQLLNASRQTSTSISMVIDPEQSYNDILSLFEEPCLYDTELTYGMVEVDNVSLRPSEEYLQDFNYNYFIALVNYFRSGVVPKINKLINNAIVAFDGNRGFISKSRLGSTAAPTGPCIPGKLRLLVSCFGDFYPCEKVNESESMKIGSLDNGFDLKNVEKLLNVGKLAPEECKSCWALPLCSVCARHLDEKGKLSVSMRSKACEESRGSAFSMILEKILLFENQQHMHEHNWRVNR